MGHGNMLDLLLEYGKWFFRRSHSIKIHYLYILLCVKSILESDFEWRILPQEKCSGDIMKLVPLHQYFIQEAVIYLWYQIIIIKKKHQIHDTERYISCSRSHLLINLSLQSNNPVYILYFLRCRYWRRRQSGRERIDDRRQIRPQGVRAPSLPLPVATTRQTGALAGLRAHVCASIPRFCQSCVVEGHASAGLLHADLTARWWRVLVNMIKKYDDT